MRRRGHSVMELVVAVGLGAMLLVIVYQLFHMIFGRGNQRSLSILTQRSFLQKDLKAGFRRLETRLRECIQVLEPLPGASGQALVVRDVTNQTIRVRLDPSRGQLISERQEKGVWKLETQPNMIEAGGAKLVASWPISMLHCVKAHFTTLSPDCISLWTVLEFEGQQTSLVTLVKLRNSNVSY